MKQRYEHFAHSRTDGAHGGGAHRLGERAQGLAHAEMDLAVRAVRHKVSNDRYRFVDGKYDLDLTYVTNNVIGAYKR